MIYWRRLAFNVSRQTLRSVGSSRLERSRIQTVRFKNRLPSTRSGFFLAANVRVCLRGRRPRAKRGFGGKDVSARVRFQRSGSLLVNAGFIILFIYFSFFFCSSVIFWKCSCFCFKSSQIAIKCVNVASLDCLINLDYRLGLQPPPCLGGNIINPVG